MFIISVVTAIHREVWGIIFTELCMRMLNMMKPLVIKYVSNGFFYSPFAISFDVLHVFVYFVFCCFGSSYIHAQHNELSCLNNNLQSQHLLNLKVVTSTIVDWSLFDFCQIHIKSNVCIEHQHYRRNSKKHSETVWMQYYSVSFSLADGTVFACVYRNYDSQQRRIFKCAFGSDLSFTNNDDNDNNNKTQCILTWKHFQTTWHLKRFSWLFVSLYIKHISYYCHHVFYPLYLAFTFTLSRA